MSIHFDILVAGAGPAGTIAAYVLAKAGRSVVLVDFCNESPYKFGESLPPSIKPLLKDLELQNILENNEHLISYGNQSAWGSAELETNDFIRDPNGHGWHLDRAKFDLALRNAAKAAGAQWISCRIGAIQKLEDNWVVQVKHAQQAQSELRAKWLLDCTGRAAIVARKLGAKRKTDDDLTALYAWTQPDASDSDSRALVESVENGWWYTAKLPNHSRIVIYHVDRELSKKIIELPEILNLHLKKTKYIQKLIDINNFICSPRSTEACGSRLDNFFGERWLAAGDAALAFDPISSQGIFKAIYSGLRAAQAIDQALSGNHQAIHAYADRQEIIRAAYLAQHKAVYQSERRWENNLFWKKRR